LKKGLSKYTLVVQLCSTQSRPSRLLSVSVLRTGGRQQAQAVYQPLALVLEVVQ